MSTTAEHALKVLHGAQKAISEGNTVSAKFALSAVDKMVMDNGHDWEYYAADKVDALLYKLQTEVR